MRNEALPLLFSVGFLGMSFWGSGGGVPPQHPHGGTPLIVSKVCPVQAVRLAGRV